jgi:mannose-6-phosphate isomerase-like protein (cupin superfamily)
MGTVISQESLPFSVIAREFEGHLHGDVGVCLIFVDAPPGRGPSLHRHPYEELFLVQEGRATFTLGDEQRQVAAGEMAIAPAGEPHAFKNTGDGPLRMIDIHVSPRFDTEWLE